MASADGLHDSGDADVDWTLLLPDEALERVLSAVPALDLVRSARFVCRRWRRLLSARPAWRRVRVSVRVGREGDACRVLRAAPALASLDLYPGDHVAASARGACLVLDAVRAARAARCEVRALSLDWRHFAEDDASRSCFHGVLAALAGTLRHLDVRLVGVRPVEEVATPLQPRPAPAIAAVAALPALTSLRLEALFDPCWYFGELRASAHSLRALDVSGCQPYLTRMLVDVLSAHEATLRALRATARGLAAASERCALGLPALQRLDVDLEHQDAAVVLPEGLSGRLGRLTIVRMNRRLPVPGVDEPSGTVASLGQKPWPSLHTLVLEDCLFSPADLAALLRGVGHGVERLVLLGGCYLGGEESLHGLTGTRNPKSTLTSFVSQGLRLCPRDLSSGLYSLALES